MKVLIVAATEAEIMPLISRKNSPVKQVEVLITGAGMVATAFSLTKHLQSNKYDFVLQAGICGCFDTNFSLGDLLFVSSDQYGDLGAEDHNNYLDIFELGLLEKNVAPYTDGKLHTPLLQVHDSILLPHVSGLTVNSVSGNEQTIKRRSEKYQCTTESMEGAAFHYVCLQERIPFAQVRAVSNYIIPRDKSQWKIKEAIINLNDWLIGFLKNRE